MEKQSTRSILELDNLHFTVESYQRGYKWTPRQVLDLLEDVSGFDPNNEAFYCLQPLALVELDNGAGYEVIDGQQRLTTIFIILTLLDRCDYTIGYRTRKGSEDFLPKIGTLGTAYKADPISDVQSIPAFEQDCLCRWNTYLEGLSEDEQKTADNSDNFYFFQAMQTVLSWTAEHEASVKTLVKQLREHTHFIWYVESSKTQPKEVFRNLNSGKIELTNAELLKAEIINGMTDANAEIQTLRQNELATEWDQFEQALHEDSFWFFIVKKKQAERYETRIDFLFELLLEKGPGKPDDALYTYREFCKRMDPESEMPLTWDDVRLAFYQLREWYEENDTYHLIGYIIDREIKTIRELFKSSEGYGKTKFKEQLVKFIREDFDSFKFEDGCGDTHDQFLAQLRYNVHNPFITRVLLLYNLELYQTSHAQYRFPFDRFKKQDWTLEHIHAQNSEDLRTLGEARDWVKSTSDLKKSFGVLKEEAERTFPVEFESIKAQLDEINGDNQDLIPDAIHEKMNAVSEQLEDYFDMHSISNMALLDGPTNSSFGKKGFSKKREKLIQIDRQPWLQSEEKGKAFIPIGTKNVFLKHSSQSLNQLSVWGAQDRADYYAHIETVLRRFLPSKGSSRGSLNVLITKSLKRLGGSDA